MKTITMRIRAMDEESGEFDDTLKTISGDVYNLTHGQVNIMENTDTYRSVYDILEDISNIWDTLSDKEHATLTELLFGKHRANTGSAIISNFETAKKVMNEFESGNYLGSAEREMEKIQNSLEYKINAFKQTITGIAQATISRDFLKNLVDDATTMLETFENFGTVLRPLYDLLGNGVSIITQLSTALGGLDKVMAGLTVAKTGGLFFKGIFGADLLRFTQDVDTLRPKVQILGNTFQKTKEQIDFTTLRQWTTTLKTGSANAQTFTTNVKQFDTALKSTNIATQREALAIQKLNADFMSGQIDEHGYKAGLDQINSSLQTAQVSTQQLSMKTKLLSGSMKLLTGVLNGIVSIGITAILSFAISGLTKLIKTHQENLEITKENLEKSKEEKKELDDIISKYSEFADKTSYTTEEKSRLKDIQNQLLDTYGTEAKGVDLVNGKYEEQLEIINKLNVSKLKNIRDDAQARYNEVAKDFDRTLTGSEGMGILGLFNKNRISIPIELQTDDLMKSLTDIKGIESLDVFGITNMSENIENQAESWREVLEVLREYGLANTDIFTKVNKKYNETIESVNDYKTALEELVKAELNYYINENPFEFDETTTKKDFEEWKSKLLENFSNEDVTFITRLNQMLTEMWSENLSEIYPEIEVNPKFTYNRKSVDKALDEIDKLFYERNQNGEITSSIFDNLEKFDKAVENIGKDGFISRKDYEELLEIYPEIRDAFSQTADGYVADMSKVVEATQTYVSEAKHSVNVAENTILWQMSDVKAEIEKTQSEIDNIQINSAGDYESKYLPLIEYLDQLNTQYGILGDTLSDVQEKDNQLSFDTVKNKVDSFKESISNLNSEMKTTSQAFAEINEKGTMTIDTALSLIENGYATAICYNEQTGALTLNASAVRDLTKAKIDDKIASLEALKGTQQYTKAIQDEINILQKMRDNIYQIMNGTYGDVAGGTNASKSSSSSSSSSEDLYKKNAEAQISALKHQYEIGNIEAIDYYNQLLDLTKYFYEGKSEYLDEYQKHEKEVYDGLAKAQKERLEAEKDKIEDVNKEQEKAIELIKAHNELTNAKGNKTIRSYSEERGWEYVEDKEAILKAKQNLDKLITDYKSDMIDNQIDEIEKMNFDALREAISKPVDIPTNADIMKDVQRSVIENIQNNSNVNDNTKNNYTINIGNINTDNAEQFLEELNNILKNGGLESYIGL